MARATKPLNQKRLAIVRVVHLRVSIATLFTWFSNQFTSFKINISIASTIIFLFLFGGKFVNLPIITHIFSMTTKTISMARSAVIYITFGTRCFLHGGILS